MKRIALLIIILGIICNYSYAQVDSHFSLFEYSQNVFNPGAAGNNDAMCVTSVHRQQWVGFNGGEGRPVTTIFSFDMPINKIKSGLGFVINQDKEGFESDLNLMLNYAYRADLDFAMLGVGLGLGVIHRTLDPDWITPSYSQGQGVGNYTDPILPRMQSKNIFDMNFGATLVGDKFWAGFSITHLLKPNVSYENISAPSYIPQQLYLVGGYDFSLPNPSFDLLTSAIIQADGFFKSTEMQLNAKILYEKKFWAGISYRMTEAIVPMVGIHLLNGISVGYSYDIGLSKISSKGSHEIMLRYCFNIDRKVDPTRSRNVRRL